MLCIQGTWHFIAARLIRDTNDKTRVVPTQEDDLESFFHVLLWVALRHTPHTLRSPHLSNTLFIYFEHGFVDADGVPWGGDQKKAQLLSPEFIGDLRLQNGPLVDLLKELQFTIASRYMSKPTQQQYNLYARMECLVDLGEFSPSDLLETVVGHYMAKENLTKPGWMYGVFSQALASPESEWQRNGHPVVHEIISHGPLGGLKRKAENDEFPKQNKKFISSDSLDKVKEDHEMEKVAEY
jgi:hypothetical protein